jgi:hypothetical protein
MSERSSISFDWIPIIGLFLLEVSWLVVKVAVVIVGSLVILNWIFG